MRRSVAQLLEQRLDVSAVLVDQIEIELNPGDGEALELLRSGMVLSVSYQRGRLLGEVSPRQLLFAGSLELARRWANRAKTEEVSPPLRRALGGEPPVAAELAEVDFHERALVLLAYRAAGALAPADAELFTRLAASPENGGDPSGLSILRDLLEHRAVIFRMPLSDEPPQPAETHGSLVSSESGERVPDVSPWTFLASGDLPGSLRLLEAEVARGDALEAGGTTYLKWPALAETQRLLTGDDEAAMALLARASFSQAGDDWVRLFGERGAARARDAKRDLLAAIERAFDGVAFPGPEHPSLYQAEAADSYHSCDQSADHQGRWQDLPDAHVVDCQWALPFLDDHGLPYYLPALMSFVVRQYGQGYPRAGQIFSAVQDYLAFPIDDASRLRRHRARHARFTRSQLAAVAQFAAYYRCSVSDRARWRALAEHGIWPAGV